MGGRLLDWMGSGVAASRPAAADMLGLNLIVADSTAFYFATDTKILSIYDDSGPSWFEIDAAALAAIALSTLPDVDVTGLADGDVLKWDNGTSFWKPLTLLFNTVEQLQDAIGAMIDNTGAGINFTYDDPTGKLKVESTITQYTDELAQDALAAAFAAGSHTGLTITYDDATNKFDFVVTVTQYTDELAQDALAAAFAAGSHTGITITYGDGANKFDFAIAEASSSEMWTGSSSAKVVTPKKVWDMAVPVSVAYGATVTLDLNTGLNFDIGSLTGPVTLANFTNAKPGQSGIIHWVQDATGGRVITYGSNFVCAGGLASNGLLSTGANKIDEMSYFVRTDGKIVISLLKDVKA